jgi:hypothetical protein
MNRATFVESARDYVERRLRKEQHLLAEFASADRARRLAGLKEASGYFRISRSFALRFDLERGLDRLAPVLEVLDRIDQKSVNDNTLTEVVRSSRHEIGLSYGRTNLLSAATKFLWLGHPDVVIIHDSQVRAALGAESGDYDAYVELWRAEYARRRADVDAACNALADQPGQIGEEVRSIARDEWFRRRVMDLVLWNAGAPIRSPRSSEVSGIK